MPIKTVIFLATFVVLVAGGLIGPAIPMIGYMLHYLIGPERQWWAASVKDWGIRFSFVLAAATAAGMLLGRRHLHFRQLLTAQEALLLVFLGIVWFTVLISEPTRTNLEPVPASVKLTKVVVFCLMLTHVATTVKVFNAVIWTLVAGTLAVGLQLYAAGPDVFKGGRLEGIGGVDFSEANAMGAFLAAMLPIIGVQFFRSRWAGRLICLAAGVFATNGIILGRSRGAVVGLAAGGVAAVFFAPQRHRLRILLGLVVFAVGGYRLADEGFWERTGTIGGHERDASAQSRLVIYEASKGMLRDHPLGVGPGNFYQSVAEYLPSEVTYRQRDAHSTFLRCWGELGVEGIVVFGILCLHTFWLLRRVAVKSRHLDARSRDQITLAAYGLGMSLVIYLGCGVTSTMLLEEVQWWLFALPVCLWRVVDNLEGRAVADVRLGPSSLTAGVETASR